MSLLRATNLVKKYRRKTALSATLELPRGKVIALVGPNGAGKSTLLHLATGLTRPTEGTIEVLDGLVPGSEAALSRIAFVSQDVALPPGLTVASALRVGAQLNAGFDVDYAEERLDWFGVELDKRTGELSGGQRAQVALTLALARGTEVLFLDEPTSALDPLARHEFLGALAAAAAERDLSVVFSSHSIEDLASVSDHIALLNGGRLALNASLDAVLERHALALGAVADLERLHGVTLVDPDMTAEVGHHLVRLDGPGALDDLSVTRPSLERIVLGYLRGDGRRGRKRERAA